MFWLLQRQEGEIVKIFIAGPRAISRLNEEIINKLESIMDNNYTVLVGDANGIDKAIQVYLNDRGYKNVIVYISGDKIRNNVGNWAINCVKIERNVKGFDYYALKDEEMAKDSDYGLMIWNGKSKGTFNNIVNLIRYNKTVYLYLTTTKKFYCINGTKDIEQMICALNNAEIERFYILKSNEYKQISINI